MMMAQGAARIAAFLFIRLFFQLGRECIGLPAKKKMPARYLQCEAGY
jgi:hypothetical protein